MIKMDRRQNEVPWRRGHFLILEIRRIFVYSTGLGHRMQNKAAEVVMSSSRQTLMDKRTLLIIGVALIIWCDDNQLTIANLVLDKDIMITTFALITIISSLSHDDYATLLWYVKKFTWLRPQLADTIIFLRCLRLMMWIYNLTVGWIWNLWVRLRNRDMMKFQGVKDHANILGAKWNKV